MFTYPMGLLGSITPAFASIQEVEITIANAASSNTASISAVTGNRTVLLFGGMTSGSPGSDSYAEWTLTDSTTVTLTRNGTSDEIVVRLIVLEWDGSIVSKVEEGQKTWPASTTTTFTLSGSFNTSRSVVFWYGNNPEVAGTNGHIEGSFAGHGGAELTGTGTVTLTRQGGASSLDTISFAVLEFQSDVLESLSLKKVDMGSNAQTITALSVNVAKTLIGYAGGSNAQSATNSMVTRLFNGAGNLQLDRGSNSINTATPYSYIIEFKNIVPITFESPTANIAFSASTTDTDTLSGSFPLSRAFAMFMGTDHNQSNSEADDYHYIAEHTALSTVTATRIATDTPVAWCYQIMSFDI